MDVFFWCAVGADGEDDKIELFLSEIKGKDIAEVIASGREKLASVPSGGGGVAVAAAPASGGAAPAAAEAKKEEKVEEKEESDDVSSFSRFILLLSSFSYSSYFVICFCYTWF